MNASDDKGIFGGSNVAATASLGATKSNQSTHTVTGFLSHRS
jgi:hypothetical protein